MKPRFDLPTSAAVLGVLALVAMQLLGGVRGYLCLCSGQAVPTQTSHCHGPHEPDCHADDAAHGAPHDEEGSGSRHEHEVLPEEPLGRPADPTPLAAVSLLPLAVLPGLETWAVRLVAKPPGGVLRGLGESPPRGVMVARTVVLLI